MKGGDGVREGGGVLEPSPNFRGLNIFQNFFRNFFLNLKKKTMKPSPKFQC